ncbi:DUF5655 domain-containing protein, partial [Micrococcus sp. SIMBA_131]
LVNATTAQSTEISNSTNGTKQIAYKTVSDYLGQSTTELQDRFEAIKSYMMALGDDVQMKTLKYYIAFKRIKNFVCLEVHPQNGK